MNMGIGIHAYGGFAWAWGAYGCMGVWVGMTHDIYTYVIVQWARDEHHVCSIKWDVTVPEQQICDFLIDWSTLPNVLTS